MVLRQRRLRIRGGAEHDQAQPVVLAARDEIGHHGLDAAQAVLALPRRVNEILRFHRLGNVQRQHQVAHGLPVFQRRLNAFRARQRQHQQGPDQNVQRQLPAVAPHPGALGRLPYRPRDGFKKWNAQGPTPLHIGGQIAVRQPPQRQQDQQPGIVKPPHDAAPSTAGWRQTRIASARAEWRAPRRAARRPAPAAAPRYPV